MIREAVEGVGFPADRVTVTLDEIAAVHEAIDLATPGDLVVALVYRIPVVWDSLTRRARDAARSVPEERTLLAG